MSKTAPLTIGFDTSAGYCAAAVAHGEKVLSHRHEAMTKGQSERLMGLLEATLSDAGVTFSNLDALGVGIGPGNFTGIRIAVSAARGLALGLDIPAVGISGFEALRLGTSGPCATAIDARREQIYLEVTGPAGEVSPPELIAATNLPDFDGPLIGTMGKPPVHAPAVAIALLAGQRYSSVSTRPAPLYLRPADAAPARDAAPVILP